MATDEIFYIRIHGYKSPRHFGPYSSSEWDPQQTVREFQSGLVPGYRAELLFNGLPAFEPVTKFGPNFGKKKRRKFPSPIWNHKKPLVEFNGGNNRWVSDEGDFVLLTRNKGIGWEPSVFISTEAASELFKYLGSI